MYRQKWEYYGGKADAKIYLPKPFDLKVLKTDLAMYITSDEEVIEMMNKIGYLEIVIKYIDGVIKSVDNRGWDIKNAIEWKKFEASSISWQQILAGKLLTIQKDIFRHLEHLFLMVR